MANLGSDYCYIKAFDITDSIFKTLKGLLVYGLQNQLFTVAEIKTWFQFESEDMKKIFFQKIDELKKFEVKKT
ncbi:MAG: hypothetical protein GTO45_01895 [Candidatus Aminicenantes bacterium]|nr:hypothetical protein [Candidatus Aminicenantes bacterium]NIN16815.1 hypothetical protein [Candidatus Aminicenantes bacterium]NIN40671.1 hypothetical protein [Candidatus Aminicenantes bacterium]NIN83494.1 hypothetical protein [Candidatus Aminicenantes bacterium]NIO79354.1 hypothetical protein [Candidatus Aminicenantes bacterium]